MVFQVFPSPYTGIHILAHEDNDYRNEQPQSECDHKDIFMPRVCQVGGCGANSTIVENCWSLRGRGHGLAESWGRRPAMRALRASGCGPI